MNRGISRFIPMVFIIVIVILVIAAIVSIARMALGGGEAEQAQEVDTSQSALLSTDSARSVRMTVRGEIVADENFRSYQVTVSPKERQFVRYKGYLSQALVDKTYTNNTKAYEQFVFALNRAGMSSGTQLTGEADDTRGICAGGVVYEFDIMNGDTSVKHLWTASCRGVRGSLRADAAALQQLFLAQVPDAKTYIGKD